MLRAQCLAAARQCGHSLELLGREEPERVPGDDRRSGTPVTRSKPPQEDFEGGNAQICLGLASPRREPDQVDGIPVLVVRVGDGGQRQEQERQLERVPPVGLEAQVVNRRDRLRARRSQLGGDDLCVMHLHEHREVRQPECAEDRRVMRKQIRTLPHPPDGIVNPCQQTVARRS